MRKVIPITLLLLGVVAGGSWYYLVGRTSPANISIVIDHPSEVRVGEPFTVSLQFSNDSDKILKDVDVLLVLPSGVAEVGEDPTHLFIERTIGDVGPGSATKQDFSVIALSDPQSVKELQATVKYRLLVNDTALFESKEKSELRIGSRALPLSFALPEKAVSGQPFDVTITYRNDGSKDFSNLLLRLSYPPNFKFTKSEPETDEGTNEWNIKTLKRGEDDEVVITGTMIGPEQSVASFQAEIIANLEGEEYAIGSETANLSIAPSPLALSFKVNDREDYIAKLEEQLTYSVHYKNNSNTPLQNVTVSATLSGELFDIRTLSSNGSLNSITNTVSWNAGNVPELALVAGGGEGTVTFTVKTKSQYPILRLGDKNYILTVQARAESPTVPSGNSGSKTMSAASYTTKVEGKLTLEAKGLYRDAASGIVNKGPYPPRVNQPTQYTVHWIFRNYSTNMSGVKVRAFLQSGAKVTGLIKSNSDTKPVYNPASGEISWDVGAIAATRGVISAPVEATFQIEQTPAVNQIGQNVVLLGESKFEAHDDFVDVDISGTAGAITTDLPQDPSITVPDRRVQP